jgi:hypothetical protein
MGNTLSTTLQTELEEEFDNFPKPDNSFKVQVYVKNKSLLFEKNCIKFTNHKKRLRDSYVAFFEPESRLRSFDLILDVNNQPYKVYKEDAIGIIVVPCLLMFCKLIYVDTKLTIVEEVHSMSKEEMKIRVNNSLSLGYSVLFVNKKNANMLTEPYDNKDQFGF